MTYEDHLSVRQARELYFEKSGFDATSYSDKWARYRVGRLSTVLVPNTQARIRAAKLHDLHHIATGYETSWVGEAEVSAWELASGGCGRHRIVWLFDTAALFLGCFINPRRVIRAFKRGIGSQNLFQQEFSETMLAQTVGSLRSNLRIKSHPH
jgi:ubiquinone biosynthesis protein Coq4